MTATRRLAAILAADVAGYSRLMGADEEGTHERLTAHRRELVDPKIAEHRGRIVKTSGDTSSATFRPTPGQLTRSSICGSLRTTPTGARIGQPCLRTRTLSRASPRSSGP